MTAASCRTLRGYADVWYKTRFLSLQRVQGKEKYKTFAPAEGVQSIKGIIRAQ